MPLTWARPRPARRPCHSDQAQRATEGSKRKRTRALGSKENSIGPRSVAPLGVWARAVLGAVTGLEIAQIGKPQGMPAFCNLRRDGLDDEAGVVAARVDEGSAAAHEPIGAAPKKGNVARARINLAPGELVDLVAGEGPEELRQLHIVHGEQMHREVASEKADPIGVVRLGKPNRVERWVQAALRMESDEASGLLAGRSCRNDCHRPVEAGGEKAERRLIRLAEPIGRHAVAIDQEVISPAATGRRLGEVTPG